MFTDCETANALLHCWFEDGLDSPEGARRLLHRCFRHDPAFDRLLDERFGSLPVRFAAGEFAYWKDTAYTALAALIVLDQLPRNLYRGTPRAYAYDPLALELSHHAEAAGYPEALPPLAGAFFNLPWEHAEDPGLQQRAVDGYTRQLLRAEPPFKPFLHEWVAAGRDHQAVIARFGRFPHRNAILGRASTEEEQRWLEDGGHHWGQVAVATSASTSTSG